MIVYGDPQESVVLGELLEDLGRLLRDSGCSLDAARTRLVRLGQLEQGIADLPDVTAELLEGAQGLTDLAANHFCRAFAGGNFNFTQLHDALHRFSFQAKPLRFTTLTIKVPEGFAFYALYPEQYLASATKWLCGHRPLPSSRAVAIGLRSIGTTLSAVVAEVLRNHGWPVQRLTVRPHGHPFSREVVLPSAKLSGASHALIVDEGPGLSGSSFAAAADALLAHGFTPERIALFPGHAGAPGPEASPATRACWAALRSFVSESGERLWPSGNLHGALAERTMETTGSAVAEFHDISAGAWRKFAYQYENEFPAVAAGFERAKFLVRLRDGRWLVWKFTGLAGTERRTHDEIFAHPPLEDRCLGFTLRRWIEGRRLTRSDLNKEFVQQLAAHIVERSQRVRPQELKSGFERLRHMACWNTKELLGEEPSRALARLGDCAEAIACDPEWPAYGDGRLAPHEFVQTDAGTIFKVDADGPHGDHTTIGVQSLLWDVAGAIVEWNLNAASASTLLQSLPVAAEAAPALRFYCASYAAFRAGLMSLAQNSTESADKVILAQAQSFYRRALIHSLAQDPFSQSIHRRTALAEH